MEDFWCWWLVDYLAGDPEEDCFVCFASAHVSRILSKPRINLSLAFSFQARRSHQARYCTVLVRMSTGMHHVLRGFSTEELVNIDCIPYCTYLLYYYYLCGRDRPRLGSGETLKILTRAPKRERSRDIYHCLIPSAERGPSDDGHEVSLLTRLLMFERAHQCSE